MSMRVVILIIVFFGAAWALTSGLRHDPNAPPPAGAVVPIDPPEAGCPGCIGEWAHNQPQPVYPKDMHQDYVPTTKPPTPFKPHKPFVPEGF